ncbi:MAG: hypothetical protein ACKO96_05275 [Flammeovirgaceae bacterium]
MNGIIHQPKISGEWHGVTVEERPFNTVDFKLRFEENGEITGTGVSQKKKGPQKVEVFGYSYLNYVVITATA